MEQQQEETGWVAGQSTQGFGAIEDLVYASDSADLSARVETGVIFPVLVTLKQGTLEEFAARVTAYFEEVRPKNGMFDPPIIGIPDIAGESLAGYEQTKKQAKIVEPAVKAVRSVKGVEGLSEQGTLLVSSEFFNLLSDTSVEASLENPVNDVASLILGAGVPLDSLPSDAVGAHQPLPELELPDKAPNKGVVVTAVIDDGMPIANARFRNALTDSRVAYCWVQNGKFATPVSNVAYGREFNKAAIDGMLTASLVAGTVDETNFYRMSGQADFGDSPRRTLLGNALTHGSSVMDLAAGYDADSDPAPGDNPIIAVQLPNLVTEDTSGGSLDVYVRDALEYILDRADRIADSMGSGPLPLVINFSYGFIAGPKDGTHPLEVLMDGIIKARNAKREITAICLPAGNARQAECHGEIGFAKGKPKVLPMTWQVLPDDRTPSHGVIYMPQTSGVPVASRVSVRLITPDGIASPPIEEVDGQAWEWKPGGGPTLAKISYQYLGAPTGRGRFTFSCQPTTELDRSKPTAPSGHWTVEVTRQALKPTEVLQSYIQRDDTPFGFPSRGRQSTFVDQNYEVFTVTGLPVDVDSPEAYVKRDGTLNGMGTGAETIVIGGFQRMEGAPALYSSSGPELGRVGPDAAGVSDSSEVATGVLAGMAHSGGVFALNGTSISTPQIARRIAQEMSAGTWSGKGDLAGWVVSPPLPQGWPVTLLPTRVGAGRILTDPVYPIGR